ncbi:O-antigen ligase family protein [Desulfobacula sp.]|uniref:O-antigen ligase family protein n=1 Tax=Desulfobacula sp. TaxID=2593537 RepID=UPI00271506A2|nr:O-antigen ligase family protein [Desulfobacula sp.]
MLTFVAPLIAYLMSFPIMLIALFRVEIGILFFITLVPIIAAMKKICEFPQGHNLADFLLISLVIGWVLKAGRENRSIFKSSPVNVVVMLMVLGSIINLIRGYTFMALPSDINLTRLMAWKNYMILPLLYFIALNNINTEKFVKWILICVCFTMLAMDFNFYSTFRWIRADHYSDSIRISGSFSFLGPNELGIFYSMYTFLLLGISYFIEDKKLRYLVLFVCACNFYPIMYSYSRSAYMCTAVGFLSLGLLKDRRLLILLFGLIFFYSFILPNSVVERIDMTFLNKTEVSEKKVQSSMVNVGGISVDTVGRKELWEKARNYFKREPLLGIGFDTFRHREGMITHSLYYKTLAEQGLVGMTIFVIFIIVLLRQSYKLFRHSKNKLGQGIGLGFFMSIIMHLVGSVGGDQSLYYNLMAIYWLFMGIVASFNVHYVDDFEHTQEVDRSAG